MMAYFEKESESAITARVIAGKPPLNLRKTSSNIGTIKFNINIRLKTVVNKTKIGYDEVYFTQKKFKTIASLCQA